MNDILHVLKNMFANLKNWSDNTSGKKSSTESCLYKNAKSYADYIPDGNDIRIVTAEGTLILTDDKTIGGLWLTLGYDPCSGTERECLDNMGELIKEHFEDVYESIVFEISEHTYLLNLADTINRGASNCLNLGYISRLEHQIQTFYPIIRSFCEKHSEQKRLGLVNLLGGGTSVGLAKLMTMLKSDGYECYIEQSILPFQLKDISEIPIEYCDYVSDKNYERFDCQPYLSGGIANDLFDTIIEAMNNRIISRMYGLPEEKNNLSGNTPTESSSMLISYGQTRTLADILIGLDQEEKFSDSHSAIDAVENYVMMQEKEHMSISSLAFSILAHVLESCPVFVDGHLSDNVVKMCFEQKQFNALYKEAMFKYCYAKIWKLICYLNDFRRYTNPKDIIEDLMRIDLHSYASMFDCWANYPQLFFRRAVNEAWPIFAPHGSIDPNLLNKYMFENHESAIRAIGLEKTISRDFKMNSCHNDAFSPKLIGTAPVYVEKNNRCGRRFVKSCGEGIGPYSYCEAHEFRYAERILWNDPHYSVYGEYDCYWNFCPKYIVPIHDKTLPVYAYSRGGDLGEKMVFNTDDERNEFYENALHGLCIASQEVIHGWFL